MSRAHCILNTSCYLVGGGERIIEVQVMDGRLEEHTRRLHGEALTEDELYAAGVYGHTAHASRGLMAATICQNPSLEGLTSERPEG